MKHAILATTIAALSTLPADGALITWGAAQSITGDSDVSTDGTLVGAFNMGFSGVSGTTVNGVNFAPFGLSGIAGSIGDFSFTGPFFGENNGLGAAAAPFSSLSASYRTLLGSGLVTSGVPGGNFTLTISGLTIGTTYTFQWWSSSSQSFTGFDTTTATSGASVVSLDKNTANATGGIGQWAIGTFTADGASQAISFTSTGLPVLNGFQLRAASVPEPGTALAGVMLAGLLGVRRRRR